MDHRTIFSENYAEAREKFLNAVKAAGGRLESYLHPLKGPTGEELATDVARFGPPEAQKILMLIAGTHGVEGLTGSACMIDWLNAGNHHRLGPGVAAVLVHFINPYGAAWRRRQTEGNIDLNRNFVDHDKKVYPQNAAYEDLHAALLCPALSGPERLAADAVLDDYKRRHGVRAYNAAILTGQYKHADGLFFGGNHPAWSNNTILEIAQSHCRAAREVAIIDFHTGLGPYGYGILVNADEAGSLELTQAYDWFGKTVYAFRATPKAAQADDGPTATGDMCGGIKRALPGAHVVYVALEYGTYEVERMIAAYRADCWLLRYGRSPSAEAEAITAAFEDFFYPRFDDWREMIWWRARQVVRQASEGLAAI